MACFFHFENFISWSHSPELYSTLISQLALNVASSQNQRKMLLALSDTLCTQKTATCETLLNRLQPGSAAIPTKIPCCHQALCLGQPCLLLTKRLHAPILEAWSSPPACQLWAGPCSSARTPLWKAVWHTSPPPSLLGEQFYFNILTENNHKKPPSSQASTSGLDWTTPGRSEYS